MAAQPVAPTPDELKALSAQQGQRRADLIVPAPAALSVDITTRAEARAFYNAIYGLSEGIPSGWTGSLSGTPGVSVTNSSVGTTSAAFQAAEQLRINWFRAMGGIPAQIAFDPVNYSAWDAQAALMMSANNQLNHYPPVGWLAYTSEGATAAGSSNLSLGVDGPSAITGYVMDGGSNNAEVGHRRWILYPQTQTMGSGDVDATGSFLAANATWVIDSKFGGTRPNTRDGFVAWPPPGYVPYQVVFPRWSFSYPNADFTNATVTMMSNGVPVAVAPEVQAQGYGENTIVWDYNGLNGSTDESPAPNPGADTPYTVTVNNIVGIPGGQTSFTYTVTVFDPAVAGTGDNPPTVSGSSQATVGVSSAYSVAGIPSFADGFEYRTVGSVAPATTTFDAGVGSGGLDGLVAVTSGGYSPVDTSEVYAGTTASFYLGQPDGTTQTLTLPGYYTFTSGAASLKFESWLGFASSHQTAHAQISTDDGNSWDDLYTLQGNTDVTSNPVETGFAAHTLSLSAYAGLVFQIRFAYTFSGNGSFYTPGQESGWNIDAISFTGVDSATPGSAGAYATGTSFTNTPAVSGSFGLQARAVLFGLYPLSWGPVTDVTASTQSVAPPVITVQPMGQVLNSGSTVVFTGGATGATGYQWMFNGNPISDSPSGTTSNIITGSSGPQLVITNATAASDGSYTLVASGNGGSTPSSAASLAVSSSANPGFLVNISSRAFVGTGSNILIGGFYVGGSTSRSVLIQGLGPALANEGVPGTLAHPALKIYNSSGVEIYSDTGWGNGKVLLKAAAAAYANPVLQADSADSEVLLTLPPGGYTAQVSGADGGTGVALCAIYQLP